MTLLADGRGQCNRCGQEEESTSILLFLTVSDITDTAAMDVRHYCRRNGCSTAIRDAGQGQPPHPQTTDQGTTSDQTASDGTRPPDDDATDTTTENTDA